ncbi:MAG: ABC transporter permease [Gammaproteobacteria bacterium]|jgi:ABC-2 type transport system permease protein|nr:ABC transporter permease [Gammaproteobacteria bacterium]|tara:strand:- start:5110 stop:6222 length:1113 start_codon:yes stop_codon:yes gene_type:complete
MSFVRLVGLLRKEAVQFLRDRLVLALVLWLYTVEAVLCTYALSFEVENLPVAVVDQDRSLSSRKLIDLFTLSDAFELADHAASPREAATWLESGRVNMVMIVPGGFGRAYHTATLPAIQFLFDGTNSNTAANARLYAMELLRRFELEHPSLSAGPVPHQAEPIIRTWYNPDQTTSAFMVLSMIALAGMMVGVIHPAASIVRERERGTIEQLLVTPIRLVELFTAKTAPTLLMGTLALFPSLLIVAWFDVPLRGSFALFMVLTALFLLSAIGLGVMIAAVSQTLQQALLLAFFGLFPIMFLSGTLTPVESMPSVLQTLSLASPLRYYMDIILSVFLKGAGWAELWDEALALLAIGTGLFCLSAMVFKKRVT